MLTNSLRHGNKDDHVFNGIVKMISNSFKTISEPIFTTDCGEVLWDAYINSFPEEDRQYHNCNTCKKFIKNFGGMVTIDHFGYTHSALWTHGIADKKHLLSFSAMRLIAESSKVNGVFSSDRKVLWTPSAGPWNHFYVEQNPQKVFYGNLKNPHQKMCEKREDFNNVVNALEAYSLPVLEQALKVLKSGALPYGFKVLRPVQWLYDLKKQIKEKYSINLVWKATATVPSGFCHPRGSVTGTLLDDIASGMNFETISRRFAEKMNPRIYQRPQTSPDSGNVEQAEKIIEKMGAAKSLERRFARLDEIETLWKPVQEKKDSIHGGVFSNIKTKNKNEINELHIPAVKITWVKFKDTILCGADSIDVLIPMYGGFVAFTSAVYMDAPFILKWSNTIDVYQVVNVSWCERWLLSAGELKPVTAVCLHPKQWGGSDSYNGIESAYFIIDGAVDTENKNLALFPENLKSEFHGIRKTIESYSASKGLSGYKEASACGISAVGSTVSVNGIKYHIDRWD